MFKKLTFSIFVLGIATMLIVCATANTHGGAFVKKTFSFAQHADTTIDSTGTDSLIFPLQDRYAPPVVDTAENAIDLKNPSNIKKDVQYDPATHQYIIDEKLGNHYYRKPMYIGFDQYMQLEGNKLENDYWQQRASLMSELNRKTDQPKMYKGPLLYNRTFGGTTADIRPQGTLDLTFGYEGQNYKNLTLPERARKTGGPVFDMDINMNVTGRIGKKLKITSTYNTQSVFDFEKQVKLEYTGDDDEIIKKIEAGNVSFPLRSQLITGVQSLFGIKTQLQFGRLTVTGVLSNQKSQKQNLMIQNGSQTQTFALQADQYEDNRHFLLAQYFHDHYDQAMSNLPVINSQVNINRLEVWVTNKNGSTTDTRDVVGLMDLGESTPYNSNVHSLTTNALPQNTANDEYRNIISNPTSRNPGTVVNTLTSMGLQPVQDFEKTFARQLDSTEYTYHPKLGYISLNQQLQPDEVLAVAYQYSYNGKIYQVGEFSQDVPPAQDGSNKKILFLKLLKATSERPKLPIWKLMMKNIYSTGAYQISTEDFQFNIFYQDPGGGEKRYLPDAQGQYQGQPLLSILSLDRLNNQNDPQPDGVFDFVDGYTVNTQSGRIIFPVLQPFGNALRKVFNGNQQLINQYVYEPLYDSTKTIAQQFPQLNRYVMRGSFKSSSSSDISLGGFNIPPGSVTVTAGGQVLTENVDYTIDYSLGRLKILNTGILNAGIPINVQYENNATYGQQNRNYMGARLDYEVNDKLTLGATVVKMSERPYFSIVNYGDDPINNTMLGLDVNYQSELPGLTHWLDKLPNYATTAPSTVTANGEVARLLPGHSKLIGKQGTVYIDDFEGSSSGYDLKFPYNSWSLASTPVGATNQYGNVLFPEASLVDSLPYNKNRAKLAWYTIEQSLVDQGPGTPDYLKQDKDQLSNPYVHPIQQQEVFPNRSVDFGQNYISTFDLAYYPTERGPYNFDTEQGDVNADGKLSHPEDRWGGIMRSIDNSDFETSNVEYIEFWVMDPFILDSTSTGGDLYINLGNISEDILKDSRKFFENGMPDPSDKSKLDSSVWGYIPKFQQQITNAFDNDPAARAYQDVGYDGLGDANERNFRQQYLLALATNFGTNSAIYQKALADPDNDDYHYYRGSDFDNLKLPVLDRYKRFNNPDGNSPVSGPKDQYSTAATNYPETEDINHDNTLNETEEYFQYRVHLTTNMQVGSNYLADEQVSNVKLANGKTRTERWYQFKIPIHQYDSKVGDIPDFKSIRFMRMFMTNFRDSTILRFAQLELVRNQWRTYQYSLKPTSGTIPIDSSNTDFNISSVNIEENAQREPVPYVIPPGIERQTQTSTNNVNLQLNEQSLSMNVCNLQNGDARGVFKTLDLDLRQYGDLQMFIHAEAVNGPTDLKDGDVQAIIRLGSDFVNNYYEYKIPLKVTAWNSVLPSVIWPQRNELDLILSSLPDLKQERNRAGASTTEPFTQQDAAGNYVTIVGNPNLGDVKSILIGVLNPDKQQTDSVPDDGLPKCANIWFDEMRLTNLNEKGGYAAIGRVDFQLADLGTFSLSGAMHTAGFGSIDQQVNDRFKDYYHQFDVATNLNLGKLLPASAGLSIPVYAGYSETVSNPEYDPYDLDIKLRDKLRVANTGFERDSIRRAAQDFTSIKSLNFTNIRKITPGKTTNHLWDIDNFDLSYSYTQTIHHDPLIESDVITEHRLGLGYTFNGRSKFISPFHNMIKSKSHYFDLLRDFNINPIPSLISLRADLRRQFGASQVRNIGGGKYRIPETYDKYFTFDTYYALKWDFTRSLTLDFNAVNNARIDEPYGRINTKAEKDTIWNNLLNFGRTTLFHQTANISYTLPLNKFPLLNWTTVRLGYATEYNWMAASQLALYLGNTIENSQEKQVNAELNFNNLYNKIPFLKKINSISRPRNNHQNDSTANKNGQNNKQASSRKTAPTEISPILKAIIKPILSLKRIAINYSENANTELPGYLDSTNFFSNKFASYAPGIKFAFGYQPDKVYLDKIAHKGWITPDTTLNIEYQQNYTQKLDVQASLEPYNDLRIDVNLTKSFTKTHTELFKDTSGGNFAHLNPYDAGAFNISYIAMKTLFGKINTTNGISQTFLDFERYRSIISQRLGEKNPYSSGSDPNDPGYAEGYGRYAEDVLVPSFLAAYTGKDPEHISLLNEKNKNIKDNPFKSYFPKPNWQITYNGLSKVGFFKNFLTNFTITNAYTSSLSMNSFQSALLYQDPFDLGFPSFVDTVSGNYIPYFLVPNITISEQFAPLIGLDMTFNNNINARVEYRLSRTLSLSLVDYQLTEVRSSEITIGGGFRIRGFVLPFNISKSGKQQSNDLNFRLDLSYRDDKTVNNQLDADLVIPTSGQKVILISPSIDYVVNNRLNLHFFYERRQTIPVISTSYPISNTRGGVTLRFALQ